MALRCRPAWSRCNSSSSRPGEIRVVTDGTVPGLPDARDPIVLVPCPPDATTPERFNLARQGSEAKLLLFSNHRCASNIRTRSRP